MDERSQENRSLYELEFPGPAVSGPQGDGPVLVHALEGRRPSDEELARLEKLIAQAKSRGKPKRKK